MGTKSYFNVYLRNFLFILCVPIITIFLLYIQSVRSVEKQIVSANNNTLHQFFRLIDAEIEEMKSLVIALGSDEKCITYAQYAVDSPNKTGYQGVLLSKALSEYGDEKYEDIFVYYPYEDRVVSGTHSILNKGRYWETYYKASEFTEFEKSLDCQSFKPVLCSISSDEQSYLCVAMRKRNGRNPQRDFVVVVVMRPSYLEKIMVVDEREENGELIIFNENHDVLIGDMINKQDGFELLNGEKERYVTYLGNTKYMVHMKTAECITGGYAFIMPYDYFWRELFSLRTICGIGAVLCIVVSMYMAYKSTKRVYRPIENMIEQLSGDTNYNKKENNEFEFFESIVQRKNKKIYTLEKQLIEDEEIRKQHFARTLLEGDITDAVLEEGFLNREISLSVDKFCVAAVNVKGSPELEEELQRFVVSNVIEELYGFPIYVALMSKERYAIIFCLVQDMTKENVIRTLREGNAFFEKSGKILLSIGLGEVYEGVQGMRKSYKEAVKALGYKWLLGEGNIIEYANICQRKFDYNSGTESKIYRIIMDYIKGEEEEVADKLVTKIWELYDINAEVSMDTIECFKYEVLNVLNNVIMHIGAPEVNGTLLLQLMELPTVSTYKEELALLFNDLHVWYRGNVKDDGVCSKVKSYVEKNYSDPQLSVAEISRAVNLTSSYLTKQFKDRYNISILDYIAQTRIKNAKVLLQDASLSVKQVSSMVGFMSDNVFIKTFKKWEGITPKNYRNLPFEP